MNVVNQFLLNHNRQQSDFFLSPDEVAKRKLYMAHHPVFVQVLKCMDGRVNVPKMTDDEVPMGVIAPFRNMGGRFKIGSPAFAPHVRNFYDHALRAMAEGTTKGALTIVTYHYSAGDTHRGCKGFAYDTEGAKAYTAALRRDYDQVYGKAHEVAYNIQMGIETDKEMFVFHADASDATLVMGEYLNAAPEELKERLRQLYPDMKQEVFDTLASFAIGNQRHIKKRTLENRVIEKLDHTEQVIAVGRGFDWLHIINKALIIGPFSVGWPNEVEVAAGIVLSNFKAGRIERGEGAVLLISAPYRTPGVDAGVATYKALEMARLSYKVIKEKVPELLEYNLEVVVGTLDRSTMLMRRIDFDPQSVT